MKNLIEQAFLEDLPGRDITTAALNVTEKYGIAQIIAKQDLILSGTEAFNQSLLFCDPELQVSWQFSDGEEVLDRQVVAQVSGNLVNLIQAERVALNFLGYLSGIATQTHFYVKACQQTNTRILDTRKTLPGYRLLAKQAVVHGGGQNHRMSLSDAAMIKENHVALAGGLRQAIEKLKEQNLPFIEVEATDLDDVKEAVAQNVQQIMLDNMDNATMAQALKLIPKHIKTEASGNMTLERIADVAKLGVDFISIGALTHSVTNADFSMIFDWS